MIYRAGSLLPGCYSGSIGQRLSLARWLYIRHGETLLKRPDIRARLTLLRQTAKDLSAHMAGMGLGTLCAACAVRPGGGCCGAAIGDDCDAPLLLINLLLGVEIICQDIDPVGCRFLGASGCIFAAKPIFCLNYNCDKILKTARQETLDVLYLLAGKTLGQQGRVETLLLDFLRKHME